MAPPAAAAPGHRALLLLWGALAAAALLALAGIGWIPGALALRDEAAALANPYWMPGQALLLYLLVPLASVATGIFFLGPGLLLAAALGRPKGPAHWLLAGFLLALLLLAGATTLWQGLTGQILRLQPFFLLVLLLHLPGLLLTLRAARGGGTGLRLDPAAPWSDLAGALLLPLATLLLLSAKFYWEAFSPDGSGALQFARVYIATLWPFWPPEAGTISQAPDFTSFLFSVPGSWYVRLLGESEFAVRVPYLLYLTLLWPVLLQLVRTGREAPGPDAVAQLLIAAALLLYTLAVIYSGGYLPFFNDSPMPAVRETLAVACFLAYVLCFVEGRLPLMLAFGLMAHMTIPSGGLWLVIWPAAVLLLWRPVPWARLLWAGATVLLAAAISLLGPKLALLAGLPLPGDEFGAGNILTRLRHVAPFDWYRFGFLAIPTGLLPALFLLMPKRGDRIAMALALATGLFFLFFYLQGYRVLLHHFVPAMLPPLVLLWRHPLAARASVRLAALAGLLAATWLAWPRETGLHGFDREIGAHIAVEGPRFRPRAPLPGEHFPGFAPEALDTFHVLFGDLFPIGYRNRDPEERFFGGPLVWYFYALAPKPAGQTVNYLIRPLDGSGPADGTLMGSHDGYGLFVRDMGLYERHRTTRLPVGTGAPLLATPREVIFRSGPKGERTVFDIVPPLKRLLGLAPEAAKETTLAP
jgi:hypothetical protein